MPELLSTLLRGISKNRDTRNGIARRAAQSKVVKMMVPNLGEMKDEKHPQNGR